MPEVVGYERFSSLIQTYILYLKGSTDGHDPRIERSWDAEFLVLRNGIFQRLVHLVLDGGCAIHTAGEHVVHCVSKRLSQSENVSQNYMIADEMAHINYSLEITENISNGPSSPKLGENALFSNNCG